MQYEVSGSGKTPLVCVHGWGCEGGQFAEVAQWLEKDFRIYRPDLPGHGRTALGGFAPGFESYAAAVVEFVRDLELEKPMLLGHSMGGVLALMAARELDVRGVVNLDGSLPAAEHTLAAQKVIRGWLDLPDFRERLAAALREGFFLPTERDERCEKIIRTMCAAPEAVLRFLPEKIEELKAEEILPKIKAPVLYVGAMKPRFDLEKASFLLEGISYQQVSDCGHFLHIYRASRVADLVKAATTV